MHHEWGATNPAGFKARGPVGEPCLGVEYRHKLGDYLRPALSLGLQLGRCEEPGRRQPDKPWPDEPLPVPATEIGDWQDWPWSLMGYLPFAARVANRCPTLVIWHFQLPVT